ncbi:septum formation initiator family protein [Bacillus sp. EAC]|uniref:FtsB family cell division protein n=1 Tax=Bacillus sp. EAC TaxID=1978338 RepID=UPI000B44C21C|nr:septum formation initiator family protein [Bacillus sp. EAC]
MEHARKLDLTSQVQPKQNIVLVEEQFVTPKKRSFKKFLMRVSLFFIFAVPLIVLLQSQFQTQQHIYSSKMNQLKQVKTDLEKTKSEVKDSKQLIDQLSNDEYIIEIARKNLFFSKEGEIIFPNIK